MTPACKHMIAAEAFTEGLDPKECTASARDRTTSAPVIAAAAAAPPVHRSRFFEHDEEEEGDEEEGEEEGEEEEEEEEDDLEGYSRGRHHFWGDDSGVYSFGGTRSERASSLLVSGSVTPLDDSGKHFRVKSQSGVGSYVVTLVGRTGNCECPDFQKRQQSCKHMIAARKFAKEATEKKETLFGDGGKKTPEMVSSASRSRSSIEASPCGMSPERTAISRSVSGIVAPQPDGTTPSLRAMAIRGCVQFTWIKPQTQQSDRQDCSICFNSLCVGDPMLRLPCFHDFHEACVDKWLLQNRSCPLCRHSLDITEPGEELGPSPTKRKKP